MAETKLAVCGLCSQGCLIDATVENDRIVSVMKAQNHPHVKGALCVKGAALKQYVYHPDRLTQPLKRVGPKGSRSSYVPVRWDEAISAIAQRLLRAREESGAKASVFFAGHPKWFRRALGDLAAAYGSPNYGSESSCCNRAHGMAWDLVYGCNLRPDIAHCRNLLIWSNNPAYSRDGSLAQLRSVQKRGGKVIVVDPRVTPTAAAADLHLQIYPGTDGALALAVANVLIQENLYDREFIENYCVGFDAFRAYAAQFPPERAAAICGVSEEIIVRFAREIAGGGLSILISSCSIVHCVNGVQNERAVIMLSALTGSFDRPGGNCSAPTEKAALNDNHQKLAQRPDIDADISGGAYPVWQALVNEAQCIRLADVILTQQPYPVRNLISFGLNPQMWPQPQRMLEALEKVEFFVVTDLFWNEACERADYVLPACTAIERDQVVLTPDNHLFYLPSPLTPGDKLPDVEIMLRLAHAMDLHSEILDLTDFDAYLDYILATAGVLLAELKAAPEGLPARVTKAGKPYSYERGLKTPSGKVEFVSGLLSRYDREGYAALPEFRDWRALAGDRARYPFLLVSGGRRPQLFHSCTYRVPWLSGLEAHPMVFLHPDDAARLGLAAGDAADVSTPLGTMRFTVFADIGVKPGVVHIYHDDPGGNINRLIGSDWLDPISGFPGFRSTICAVEKANAPQEVDSK